MRQKQHTRTEISRRLCLFGMAAMVGLAISSLALAQKPGAPANVPAGTVSKHPIYEDVTDKANLKFVNSFGEQKLSSVLESAGQGCAWFDYNNDGLLDLYVLSGRYLEGVTDHSKPDGKDATNHLYRNNGDGTFTDVTEKAGVQNNRWGIGAAFVDYDRDGYLDLLVGRYVQWSPETDISCSLDGTHRIYCTPEEYRGQSNRLYRNMGGRYFQDVTQLSGIFHPEGKTLGIAVIDVNRDGWPDLVVANDTVRNFLFINNRNGTFTETGVMAGIAYSESGATRGGMGIDAGDVDGDGFTDVAVSYTHLTLPTTPYV